MDRIQVCGTCDLGSTPNGSTKYKVSGQSSGAFVFGSWLSSRKECANLVRAAARWHTAGSRLLVKL